MSESLPTILSAFGTATQVAGTLRTSRSDANALESQAAVSREQALSDEYAQRRQNRQRIGTLAASMAEGGGGVDEGVLRQSSINAELDALNTRYAGAMRAAGYNAQASAIRKNAPYLAGAQLLSGAGSIYKQRKATI